MRSNHPEERPNHLAMGAHLVARLRAEINSVRQIEQRGEMDDLVNGNQISPALYVIYQRDLLPSDSQSADANNLIQQCWLVVTVMQGNRADAFDKAGQLLARVRAAVLGWTPDFSLYGVLKAATPPPALYENSHGYYPLLFVTDFYA
ncbi:hypothetical protein HA052_22845 [Chromobacterium haemolyticum]|uniref:DUF3168 domain-containing protein n=1 Tax=Chromobacterium fluminis TaxID=3044269 RepID=A0ABX0L884_9NEIS|nr:hypothetical protein [Chromobacterium haemolyticum]NHR08032.1 hypothetical protein [Chromobacterium haemolyticum]